MNNTFSGFDPCGIEVSAETLLVERGGAEGTARRREFQNTAEGHQAVLGRWRKYSPCSVCGRAKREALIGNPANRPVVDTKTRCAGAVLASPHSNTLSFADRPDQSGRHPRLGFMQAGRFICTHRGPNRSHDAIYERAVGGKATI